MIELAKVSLRRGRATILDGAFVRIEPEQVVLVSGPSGIGKTSLLSLIGGFLCADRGEVRVFEHDVARMRATSTALLRRKLAFVPQELELIEDISALANVRIALEVCGASRKESKQRGIQALQALDMGEYLNRKVKDLSTGQRRRVSLARGIVRRSEVFVADEPTNDLDAQRVLQFVDLIEEMREGGTAVILATNDPRLLTHAHQSGWRHLALASGQLMPGDMSSLFGGRANSAAPIQEVANAEQVSSGPYEEIQVGEGNLLPFPAAAAVGAE